MRAADRISSTPWIQAESPRWTGGNEVCWVDMGGALLIVGRFENGMLDVVRTERVGTRIGSAARITGSDDWAVTCDREVRRVTVDGSQTVITRLPPGDGYMNDGICDSSGRFWTGTQTPQRTPRAALYSIDADQRPITRLDGATVSNGICFSADGKTLYYIDTLPNRAIEAFDVDADGRLTNRRAVAAVAGGNPDGMAIDADGALWVAVWHAGEVRRYAPTGELLTIVTVPASRPSAVALIDSTLIVTTAASPEAGPEDQGGHLFAVSAPAPGQPAEQFYLP
jgi:sugar lactone lactonase YvrE